MTWTHQGKPLLEAPTGSFGFVYLITNTLTGQAYVGKKQFHQHLTKRVKGKRNKKHFTKESNWKTYWSSSKDLQARVKLHGQKHYTREVLTVCMTKGELSYAEVAAQVKRDVLTATLKDGSYAYLNLNIASRWFRKAA